jgi:hypothetical protein
MKKDGFVMGYFFINSTCPLGGTTKHENLSRRMPNALRRTFFCLYLKPCTLNLTSLFHFRTIFLEKNRLKKDIILWEKTLSRFPVSGAGDLEKIKLRRLWTEYE